MKPTSDYVWIGLMAAVVLLWLWAILTCTQFQNDTAAWILNCKDALVSL